ncbi:MAG: metal ABC transporter solute-binding protein, Zn/Mn family [Gaiellaceae bacterium]
MRKTSTAILLIAIGAAVALGPAACATASRGSGRPRVVAVENFWGSIASQLGGSRVRVTSVITNPATDPHDYEPSAADARTVAEAAMLIANGIGYDPWAAKLAAANPVSGRIMLDVGDLVGVKPGGNPHQWYSPANVRRVIDAIVRDYSRLDPKDAAYFRQREASLETRGLAKYERLIATIRRKYRGVPVGASESIFQPLAQALGLRLLTPVSFLNAISEGTEPTASDKTAVDRQVATGQIKVWVENSQNSTPDVQRLTDAARRKGIPVTTITETLTPAAATFEGWQSRQLEALASALERAVHG